MQKESARVNRYQQYVLILVLMLFPMLWFVSEATAGTVGWCATEDRSSAKTEHGTLQICPFEGACDSVAVRDGTPTDFMMIQVLFHVMRDDTGGGGVSQGLVDQALSRLNADFAPYNVEFFSNGTLFHDDSQYDCVAAYTFADNGAAFLNGVAELQRAYATSPEGQCNIVISCQDPGDKTIYGKGTLPWDSTAPPLEHGLWLNTVALESHQGTITHEMGHCLGLWHIFRGLENCDSCAPFVGDPDPDLRGDFASDTPPVPSDTNCTDISETDCNSNVWLIAQPENYMGYAERCWESFTPQQMRRMHCWSREVRSGWFVDMTPAVGTWEHQLTAGMEPTARDNHTMIYDTHTDRAIIYGGLDNTDTDLGDVWALSLVGSPQWTELFPAGTPPSPRRAHTAIYDPTENRMIVFGGRSGVDYLKDVWQLSLGSTPAWTEIIPTGADTDYRFQHRAVYSVNQGAMIIFGSYHNYPVSNEAFLLNLNSNVWSAVGGAGPTHRGNHSAIYDWRKNRMLLFGGDDGPHPHEKDTWELSFDGDPAWSELFPSGTIPPERWGHSAIYDFVRNRMVIFGGIADTSYNDTWSLSLDSPEEWTQLNPLGGPPSARRMHKAIYDARSDRMVVFGGRDDTNERLNEVWTLGWGVPVAIPDEPAPAVVTSQHLRPNVPNPFNPNTVIPYVVTATGRVTITVYDVAGGFVSRLVDAYLSSGTYEARWNGELSNGQIASSGVYFVRYQQPNETETRKIVLIK